MKFARGKRTSDASPTSSQASLLHSKPRAVPCIINARCRSLSSAHVLSHASAPQLAAFCGGHIHASGPGPSSKCRMRAPLDARRACSDAGVEFLVQLKKEEERTSRV